MRRSTALPLPAALPARLRVRPLRRTRFPAWAWPGLAIIAAAAVLPVLQSSDATATGAQLTQLEHARAARQAEVRVLASQVGELASLTRVDQVARARLHLTPAQPTTVLSVAEPPPVRLVPERFLPRQAPETPPERSLWQRMLDLLVVD